MDEVLIRSALNSMLEATKDDATPIIRRLARIQARAALDTLASAPAGDGVEAGIAFVIAEAKRTAATVATCLECSADDMRRWRETIDWLQKLALARPRAAVGERRWFPHNDFAGEPMQEGQFREPYPMAEEREAIARIIDPMVWDHPGWINSALVPGRKAASVTKADAILALQSPPAKVE